MSEHVIGENGINLTQLLKSANLAESGGHAKSLIDAGLVFVNGEIETRKRRQMKAGDFVEVKDVGMVRVKDACHKDT